MGVFTRTILAVMYGVIFRTTWSGDCCIFASTGYIHIVYTMRTVKIYLIVVTVLFCLAIALGIYVWYTVQTVQTTGGNVTATQKESVSQPLVTESQKTQDESISQPVSEEIQTEPIVIETNILSETQQNMLKTLGYSDATITITPEMISCAEEKVGATRLKEIMEGSAPGPLESAKLLPCFNTQ